MGAPLTQLLSYRQSDVVERIQSLCWISSAFLYILYVIVNALLSILLVPQFPFIPFLLYTKYLTLFNMAIDISSQFFRITAWMSAEYLFLVNHLYLGIPKSFLIFFIIEELWRGWVTELWVAVNTSKATEFAFQHLCYCFDCKYYSSKPGECQFLSTLGQLEDKAHSRLQVSSPGLLWEPPIYPVLSRRSYQLSLVICVGLPPLATLQ